MAINKAIKAIKYYEKLGYTYEIMDIEQSHYTDENSQESGDRVNIQVALKKIREDGKGEANYNPQP
jgi:hypothetical protein